MTVAAGLCGSRARTTAPAIPRAFRAPSCSTGCAGRRQRYGASFRQERVEALERGEDGSFVWSCGRDDDRAQMRSPRDRGRGRAAADRGSRRRHPARRRSPLPDLRCLRGAGPEDRDPRRWQLPRTGGDAPALLHRGPDGAEPGPAAGDAARTNGRCCRSAGVELVDEPVAELVRRGRGRMRPAGAERSGHAFRCDLYGARIARSLRARRSVSEPSTTRTACCSSTITSGPACRPLRGGRRGAGPDPDRRCHGAGRDRRERDQQQPRSTAAPGAAPPQRPVQCEHGRPQPTLEERRFRAAVVSDASVFSVRAHAWGSTRPGRGLFALAVAEIAALGAVVAIALALVP